MPVSTQQAHEQLAGRLARGGCHTPRRESGAAVCFLGSARKPRGCTVLGVGRGTTGSSRSCSLLVPVSCHGASECQPTASLQKPPGSRSGTGWGRVWARGWSHQKHGPRSVLSGQLSDGTFMNIYSARSEGLLPRGR